MISAMSALFHVRVRSVNQARVTFDVTSVHPDSGPVPKSATFALMLLSDPLRRASGKAALAQEIDDKSILDARWLDQNARAFISTTSKKGKAFVVCATDAAWVSHIKPGTHWDTAAYDAGPGKPAPPRTPRKSVKGHSDDPDEGFRKERLKPLPWRRAEHGGVSRARLPSAMFAIYPPARYVADPRLKDPAKMRAFVRNAVGDPILMKLKRRPPKIVVPVTPPKTSVHQFYAPQGGYRYARKSEFYGIGSSVDGASLVEFDDIEWLGRPWLKK